MRLSVHPHERRALVQWEMVGVNDTLGQTLSCFNTSLSTKNPTQTALQLNPGLRWEASDRLPEPRPRLFLTVFNSFVRYPVWLLDRHKSYLRRFTSGVYSGSPGLSRSSPSGSCGGKNWQSVRFRLLSSCGWSQQQRMHKPSIVTNRKLTLRSSETQNLNGQSKIIQLTCQ